MILFITAAECVTQGGDECMNQEQIMNVGMNVTQPLVQSMRMEGRCTICGAEIRANAESGMHEYTCRWNCPAKMAWFHGTKLEQRERRKISCPKCAERVAVNSDDFFECMGCHTQFTTGPFGDASCEMVDLIDCSDSRPEAGVIRTVVLSTKGKGHFPVENELRKLHKRADEARRSMEVLLKKLRHIFDVENLYFNGVKFTVDGNPRAIETLTKAMLREKKYCISLF